jgi:hypothetical protein
LSVIEAFCRAAHALPHDSGDRRPLTPLAKAGTYNPGMSSTTLLVVRHARLASLVLACVAPLAVVHAQSAPRPAPAPPDTVQNKGQASGRQNQKIEHIHVEDRGAKVDELRYGGQTQSITVQPKADVPAYEVLPNDGGRQHQGPAETGTGGNGPRVWNVLKF